MILSDRTIQKMLSDKSLIIEPLEKEQIQPASVDVRLGNTFSIVEDSYSGVITLGSKIEYKTIQAATFVCCPYTNLRHRFAGQFIHRLRRAENTKSKRPPPTMGVAY